MKTYTLVLDLLIIALLALAIHFQMSDAYLSNLHTNRAGMTRMMVVSWQTLLVFSGFCVFLRYIAGNVVR